MQYEAMIAWLLVKVLYPVCAWMLCFWLNVLRPILSPFYRPILRFVIIPAIVMVLIVEEFLWDSLVPVMRKIGAWPGFRQFEAWAPKQNRWVCLVLFIVPDLLIVPAKMLSLKLIASGYGILAIAMFIVLKVIGTAVYAWIYKLTEAKLMEFSWIRAIRDWIVEKLAKTKAWIRDKKAYSVAKASIASAKARIAIWKADWRSKRPSWLRRLYARLAIRRKIRERTE